MGNPTDPREAAIVAMTKASEAAAKWAALVFDNGEPDRGWAVTLAAGVALLGAGIAMHVVVDASFRGAGK